MRQFGQLFDDRRIVRDTLRQNCDGTVLVLYREGLVGLGLFDAFALAEGSDVGKQLLGGVGCSSVNDADHTSSSKSTTQSGAANSGFGGSRRMTISMR